MVNCGPLACGSDTDSCLDTIKEMTAETAMSVAQGASFVLSMGASSGANVGIAAAKSAIKKVSKDVLLKGAKRSFYFIKKEM